MATTYGPQLEQLQAIACTANGDQIAIAGERDVVNWPHSDIHILSMPKYQHQHSLAVDDAVTALVFIDDYLVAGTQQGQLLLFDVAASQCLQTIVGTATIQDLAYDVLTKTLIVVAQSGLLQVYQPQANQLVLQWQQSMSHRALQTIAIDSINQQFAVAGHDNVVSVFQLNAQQAIRQMTIGKAGVYALCFNDDGRMIVGCGDGSIRFAFLQGEIDQEDRAKNSPHKGKVRQLIIAKAFKDEQDHWLPRRLFSLSDAGELKVWPLDNQRQPKTLTIPAQSQRMVLIPAAKGAKKRQGGALVGVSLLRRLWVHAVERNGEVAPQGTSFESRLDELAGLLQARADTVRKDAIAALAEIPETQAQKQLETALSNEKQPELREYIVQLWLAQTRQNSRFALRTAINDADPKVRKAVFNALQQLEQQPLTAFQTALASRFDDMRLATIQGLPALRQASPLVPQLIIEGLQDKAPKLRLAALDALLQLYPDQPLSALRIAFNQGADNVREQTLLILGQQQLVQDDQGVKLLTQSLDDNDAVVRETGFWLWVLSNPKLAQTLTPYSKKIKQWQTTLQQNNALPALESNGKPDDDDLIPLFTAIACKTLDSVFRSVHCLTILQDSRVTATLLQLSRDPAVDVRRQVVEVILNALLVMPSDQQLWQRLQWLLNDSDSHVRLAAFNALLTLSEADGLKGQLAVAGQALLSYATDIRKRALQLIIKIPPDNALINDAETYLQDALDDEEESVRSEAFRTLWAWHKRQPELVLRRAVSGRYMDLRQRAINELASIKLDWAYELLLNCIADPVEEVATKAYELLTKTKKDKQQPKPHLRAMASIRPKLRAMGANGAAECRAADKDQLIKPLQDLLEDEESAVHLAAIRSIDQLDPTNQNAFAMAFNSIFYELRVVAAELCGKRRDNRAVAPIKAFLSISKIDSERPSEALRERAARALADIGDRAAIAFYQLLLNEDNGNIQEMAARGLATACQAEDSMALIHALSHKEIAVRSWVAEGLAKLGDARAVPVLAGTQRHPHLPIRKGAILSFVALGESGIQGIRQGLEDEHEEIQNLVFAVIIARDIVLARLGLPPDLLLLALSAERHEIRFAAARALEERVNDESLMPWAMQLVSPVAPERAKDRDKWPKAEVQTQLLNVLVNSLASEQPSLRYRAAQVLALRPQADAFWREAKLLVGIAQQIAPHTNWESEAVNQAEQGWIRRLFRRPLSPQPTPTQRLLTVLRFAGGGRALPKAETPLDKTALQQLAFGTYVGLIRETPNHNKSDPYHYLRRDCIVRLGELMQFKVIGEAVVLPIFRQALNDPHHMVRTTSMQVLRDYFQPSQRVLLLLNWALQAKGSGVGKQAVEELFELAKAGDKEALALIIQALNASQSDVRRASLNVLPHLYDEGSIEPWLIALKSEHNDIRLAVLGRLINSDDERVAPALNQVLESEHEDLRLQAAVALAKRGELRAMDVLASALHHEKSRIIQQALSALTTLAQVNDNAHADRVTQVLINRLENDSESNADQAGLLKALVQIGQVQSIAVVVAMIQDKRCTIQKTAFSGLLKLCLHPTEKKRCLPEGDKIPHYQEDLLLPALNTLLHHEQAEIRLQVTKTLAHIADNQVEDMLITLLEDREESIRIAACEAQIKRFDYVESASLKPLQIALQSQRRELILPAARGLALKGSEQALQSLLLVLAAGEDEQRKIAVLALGQLGDARALEYFIPILEPETELQQADAFLISTTIEALGYLIPNLEGDQQQKMRELVTQMAQSSDHDHCLGAWLGLYHIGDEQSRIQLEKLVLNARIGAYYRQMLCELLAKLKNVASEVVLVKLLDDSYQELRQAALTALNKIYPEKRTYVELFALASQYSDISQPAAAYLAKQGDVDVLLQRLPQIKQASVRRFIRQGLIRRQACPVVEIADLLKHESAAIRLDAAWIAGSVGQADKLLKSGLEQSITYAMDTWQRQQAQAVGNIDAIDINAWVVSVWALQQLGETVPKLARTLFSTTQYPMVVRQAALQMLLKQAQKEDIKLLEAALTDQQAEIRHLAGQALAALEAGNPEKLLKDTMMIDHETLAPIVQQASSKAKSAMLKDDHQRQWVLPVYLQQAGRADLLEIAKSSKDKTSRLTAIAALARLGTQEVEAELQTLLTAEKDDKMRMALFKAIRRCHRGYHVES